MELGKKGEGEDLGGFKGWEKYNQNLLLKSLKINKYRNKNSDIAVLVYLGFWCNDV